MARKTELTQTIIDDTADTLHSKGKKPSPNNIREILGVGSFSTIKKMLDIWHKKQEEESNIFIPATPNFAYQLVDKLNKELYLQNKELMEADKQKLDLDKKEYESDKQEMLNEISSLEKTITELETEKLKYIDEQEIKQKENQILQIEIATITERDKQNQKQLEILKKQNEDLIKSLSK